jgi:predicted pyridoxine 5'-phosphate oxidase superfamily flavin-nucleotide-binding protein
MVFHPGELAVQQRAGVARAASEVGEGILSSIPAGAREFVARQSMIVAASISPSGAVWASVIGGAPGFIEVVDVRRLRINSLPAAGDPLHENLVREAHIALIIPDLSAARRLRISGIGRIAEGAIHVTTAQVYANCPRYIQKRRLRGMRSWPDAAPARRASAMSPEHRAMVVQADTFFIATDYRESGADISHKGGNPGFVKVISDRRLAYPDYNGNSMFNTLGNISVSPAAGLLFVDFAGGGTLQLSGRASIDWDARRAATVAGAERIVDFELEELVENPHGFPLRYELLAPSRYNPK